MPKNAIGENGAGFCKVRKRFLLGIFTACGRHKWRLVEVVVSRTIFVAARFIAQKIAPLAKMLPF